MKKPALVLAMVVMFLPTIGSPQNPPADVPVRSSQGFSIYPFYFSIGVGAAFPGIDFGTAGRPWLDQGSDTWANGYGHNYGLGPTLEVELGFTLDRNWSFGINGEGSGFQLSQTYFSNSEFNIEPLLRYTFDRSWATPYIVLGAGTNFNMSSVPTGSSNNGSLYETSDGPYTNDISATNTMITVGLGLLWRAPTDKDSDVYIELLWDQVFTDQGGFSFFPLTAGYRFQGHE